MTGESMFEVLGPVRGWRGKTELDLGSPQQRAVLAMLLLARGRQVSMDGLVDGLWGEHVPRSAAGTVRTYISRLRRILGPGGGHPGDLAIRSIGDGYLFRLDAELLDLAVFERRLREARAARDGGNPATGARVVRDALTMWRGVPLAGIPGPYAAAHRVPLTELQLAAEEEKLAMEISQGEHLAAIAGLRALLPADPLRESLTGLLMVALYRAGRQAEALQAFHDVRHRLDEELGINPGPALQVLYQRVLRADRGLFDRAELSLGACMVA